MILRSSFWFYMIERGSVEVSDFSESGLGSFSYYFQENTSLSSIRFFSFLFSDLLPIWILTFFTSWGELLCTWSDLTCFYFFEVVLKELTYLLFKEEDDSSKISKWFDLPFVLCFSSFAFLVSSVRSDHLGFLDYNESKGLSYKGSIEVPLLKIYGEMHLKSFFEEISAIVILRYIMGFIYSYFSSLGSYFYLIISNSYALISFASTGDTEPDFWLRA